MNSSRAVGQSQSSGNSPGVRSDTGSSESSRRIDSSPASMPSSRCAYSYTTEYTPMSLSASRPLELVAARQRLMLGLRLDDTYAETPGGLRSNRFEFADRRYPYARAVDGGGVNYMRNSVKIVIDAYAGSGDTAVALAAAGANVTAIELDAAARGVILELVLTDLGHQQAGPAAFCGLEGLDGCANAFDGAGHADLPLINSRNRFDLGAMAAEHLFHGHALILPW